jgi:hypothetical protein
VDSLICKKEKFERMTFEEITIIDNLEKIIKLQDEMIQLQKESLELKTKYIALLEAQLNIIDNITTKGKVIDKDLESQKEVRTFTT